MKTQVRRVLLVTAIAILGSTQYVSAESDQSLVADIPFAFSVQQEQFAAGQYVVETLQHGYLRLRSSDNRSVILHVTPNYSRDNRAPMSKLIFSRYGREYFLRQAWIPSCDFGMDFARSNREIEVAKSFDKQMALVAVRRR